MKKIIFYIAAILILAVFAATAYINATALPAKLKTALIDELENATGREVSLGGVRFDFLKGIVVEDLTIYDSSSVIIRAKEIDCGFLIIPIFKKRIVIPEIRIESPSVLAQRKEDGSFNLAELIPKNYAPKSGVKVIVYRVILRNGNVKFADETFIPAFTKDLENVRMDIGLALPDKVTFSLSCSLPSDPAMAIRSSGEYSIPLEELDAQVIIDNLLLNEFIDYYAASEFFFPKGTVDARIAVHAEGGILDADIDALTKNLSVSKDEIAARLDSRVKARAQYDSALKQFEYAGHLDILSMDIAGIGAVGELKGLKARVDFDDWRAASDNVRMDAFGIPWKVRINLVNFANPVFDLYASSETDLSHLQKVLAENFNINFEGYAAGKAEVELALQAEGDGQPKLNGYVRVRDGTIGLGGKRFLLEEVNGETRFTPNTLAWSDLDFKCRGASYKTTGTLTNFASPGFQLDVESKDLSFRSIFAVNDKTITLSRLKGRFLNSNFSAAGSLDLGEQDSAEADLSGLLELDLGDLKDVTPKARAPARKMKASGRLAAEFSLRGDINDIKGCGIEAKIKSPYASLYGFKFANIVMDYLQEDGVGYIRSGRSSFYGGSIWATGKVDWYSKGLSYSVKADARDVKLEALKKETGFRDKDVSGDIRASADINGSFKDLSRFVGTGSISIAKGRLWQLNLFKGIGALLFTSDFSDIVFAEGSCDFSIKDRIIFANNLALKSDLLVLYGSGRVGFDRSLAASLKAEVDEEAMYPGLQRNIATVIGKYAQINVSGTLAEPKYKIAASVADIVEDIAERLGQ